MQFVRHCGVPVDLAEEVVDHRQLDVSEPVDGKRSEATELAIAPEAAG
ncbi:hypothetical protein [Amycolatopsis sp. lyj-23]